MCRVHPAACENLLVFESSYLENQSYDLLETSPVGRSRQDLSNAVSFITLATFKVQQPALQKCAVCSKFLIFLESCPPMEPDCSAPNPTIFFKLCQSLDLDSSFPTVYRTIPQRHCEWHFCLPPQKYEILYGRYPKGGSDPPKSKNIPRYRQNINVPKVSSQYIQPFLRYFENN